MTIETDRQEAETAKLRAETSKLRAEADKLAAEQLIKLAEGLKMQRDRFLAPAAAIIGGLGLFLGAAAVMIRLLWVVTPGGSG